MKHDPQRFWTVPFRDDVSHDARDDASDAGSLRKGLRYGLLISAFIWLLIIGALVLLF